MITSQSLAPSSIPPGALRRRPPPPLPVARPSKWSARQSSRTWPPTPSAWPPSTPSAPGSPHSWSSATPCCYAHRGERVRSRVARCCVLAGQTWPGMLSTPRLPPNCATHCSDGSASSVQPQAADVLAAVRSKGLPIAVLACGLPAARLQALLDAHQLGPFRSLVRWLVCWAVLPPLAVHALGSQLLQSTQARPAPSSPLQAGLQQQQQRRRGSRPADGPAQRGGRSVCRHAAAG